MSNNDVNNLNTNNKINKEANKEEEGISLRDLFGIIRKHILVILIFIFAGGLIGLGVDFILPKSYSSTATMLVSPSNEDGSSTGNVNEYQYSSYISKTYIVFITQDIVLDKVSEDLDAAYGYTFTTKDLLEKTSVSLESSSLVVKVTFTTNDAIVAKNVANMISKNAVLISNTVDAKSVPAYKLLYGNIAVLSEAKTGTKDSHLLRDVGIGLAVGLVGAVIYAWLKEALDNGFKSSDEVEKVLGIPVLSEIPFYDVESIRNKKGSKHNE